MQPLISIIVPVFNGAEYLPVCLNSILLQTYRNFEVVIINDGSTDDTQKICCEYRDKSRKVRYYERANHGLAATRNFGILEAQGAYISFIDADDWIEPTYLTYLYELLQNGAYTISACNHWVCRGAKRVPRFQVSDAQTSLSLRDAYAHILYDRYPDVSAWGKLYAKKVLAAIQYPEGRLFEDTYRIAEILLAGGGLIYGAQPQYHYRIQTDSLSRGRFNQSKLDFLTAVDHMTETMAAHCDGLEKGIARRRMHALLSTRRYLVGYGEAEAEIRDTLERRIRAGAPAVLRDRLAPLRDKIGILSAGMGTGVYDALWTAYERIRRT